MWRRQILKIGSDESWETAACCWMPEKVDERGVYYLFSSPLHCKCFDHKNYGDWKLRGPCRENLHYLCKRAERIEGFPCNCGVSPQFLQPFSIDGADFPCRGPEISSLCSFYGQNICSVCKIQTEENLVRSHELKCHFIRGYIPNFSNAFFQTLEYFQVLQIQILF